MKNIHINLSINVMIHRIENIYEHNRGLYLLYESSSKSRANIVNVSKGRETSYISVEVNDPEFPRQIPFIGRVAIIGHDSLFLIVSIICLNRRYYWGNGWQITWQFNYKSIAAPIYDWWCWFMKTINKVVSIITRVSIKCFRTPSDNNGIIAGTPRYFQLIR